MADEKKPTLKIVGNNLTSKQELFSQEYVKGNNASDAYRKAYSVSKNSKQATIWRSAHEVLKNHKVTARIKALTKRKEETALTTTLSLSRYIVERLVEETKGENPSSRLKALELLGRHRDIDLFNPESKVNVTVNNNRSSTELEADIREKLRLVLSKN
jgi:phage terminase small subunit